MNSSLSHYSVRNFVRGLLLIGACAWGVAAPTIAGAAATPTPKLYVASLKGESQAVSGGRVITLTAKAAFPGQGAKIETRPHGTVALVLSNGSGIFLDQDTQIDIKRFSQEPFVASRSDLEREPSVSHTEIFISRGLLAVSTSKLAAGSTFTILTPLGSIHLHDGNFVIEVQPDQVRISLVAGEGTVYGGEFDLGGHLIKTGDQAIIRPGASGRANLVTVGKFPALELDVLQAAADMARAARKTVFFQTDETGEINALPVVVPSVPVQATVSPSRLPN